MKNVTALSLLLLAALLETGGDSMVRMGIRTHSFGARLVWWIAAAAMLFAYGWVVNSPAWDFGRLLGVYVVFFFVVAQILSWAVFGQKPGTPVLLGGLLIVAGGAVITLWRV